MRKYLIRVSIIVLAVFLLVWGASILKCEVLTYFYGSQFSIIYQENTMMGEIDYLKILNYSTRTARVYYVSKNRTGGDILIFTKRNGKWVYEKWERTVWSKTGSADGFVWPYIR